MSNKQGISPYDKRRLSEKEKEQYWQLFVNRTDTYAEQTHDGRQYIRHEAPLTSDVLFSDATVGPYQLDQKSNLIYACLDLDLTSEVQKSCKGNPELFDEWLETIRQYTMQVYDAMKALGITCYTEFSGNKGYHIWVFLDKPTYAGDVRRWLLRLQALLPEKPKGIEIELYPKQDSIVAGKLGNFVKPPLQLNRKSGKYAHFLDDAFNPVAGLPVIERTGLVMLPAPPESQDVEEADMEEVQSVPQATSGQRELLPIERLDPVIENCAYMKGLLDHIDKNPMYLGNNERLWLAGILRWFGEGDETVHEYFNKLEDYSPAITQEKLNGMSGKPSKCKSAPNCKKKCNAIKRLGKNGQGKKSPIAFAYQVQYREEFDSSEPFIFINEMAGGPWYFVRGKVRSIQRADLPSLVSSYGLEKREVYPLLTPIFDPQNPFFVDHATKTINFFERTEYMGLQPTKESIDLKTACPNIYLVLSNIIPRDNERDHHINWLSSILKTLEKMKTSFVFTGDQGAGKNTYFSYVLKPLFGMSQCRIVESSQLESDYNPYMLNTFFIAFNEIAYDSKSRTKLNNKIKGYITDEEVTINDKWSKMFDIENRMNCVFFSNSMVPIKIEPSDRRFTVIKTGPDLALKIKDKPTFFDDLKKEVPRFAQYLMNYKHDIKRANTVLNTKEKASMVGAIEDFYQEFATKLIERDADWFQKNCDAVDWEGKPVAKAPVHINHAIERKYARKLFNAIYGTEVTTVVLGKKLALYGIDSKKSDGTHYFVW